MSQNPLRPNHVLQREARQKRMIIRSHKRAQRLKVDATQSSPSNGQPMHEPCMSDRECSPSHVTRLNDPLRPNHVLQREARQKRMIIRSHKQAQRLKVDATQSSPSNGQPMHEPCMSNREYSPSHVTRLNDPLRPNHVLQREARQKRMIIRSHKRAQCLKIDATQSSPSNGQPMHKPCMSDRECSPSHVMRLSDCLPGGLSPRTLLSDLNTEESSVPCVQTIPYSEGGEFNNQANYMPETNMVTNIRLNGNSPQLLANDIQGYIGNNNFVHDHMLRTDNEIYPVIDYHDIGDPTSICPSCGAKLWLDERIRKQKDTSSPKFFLCCGCGKIGLPLLNEPPSYLKELVFDAASPKRKHFLDNIRAYNMMFSFTSMGGKVDRAVNDAQGPYSFRLYGENYHFLGSLLPIEGQPPKFAQLYIYDTENEIENRLSAISSSSDGNNQLDSEIVSQLKNMLNQFNSFAKAFRMASEKFKDNNRQELKLRLIQRRNQDGRTYNLPSSSEVATLVVGDIDMNFGSRDIIIQTQSGLLQRISELHPSYLPMHYPLIFPYGEDGYRENISYRCQLRKRSRVTMREFFAYRLQERDNDHSILLYCRRLLQQFMVDGYTMIEAQRLSFIRFNQKQLRCELYSCLADALLQGDRIASSLGKRIVLPSSFTGGSRYTGQNFLDAMTICKWAGCLDLFITFTCNPNWPEILRFVQSRGLRPEDRPDIITRVFKIKLEHLMKDLKNGLFGRVRAMFYTVEFQKRGLPHAHILLFLHPEDKVPTVEDIDRIICAEIPDKETNPVLHNNVGNFMMHGPCGFANRRSPCLQDGKCTKHFPKRFVASTRIDENGFPIYRRRDNSRTILKNGVKLDNRVVVPYNSYLLMKYQAHINVEWCNQSRSVKYLFKCVNKGNDRVTAALYERNPNSDTTQVVDEIKLYCDCRYISACEAVWRIFMFDIHYRQPSVERLSFHLPNQQVVVYEDGDNLDSVISKPQVKQTMFLAWMEANNQYPNAKELTYIDFPSRFVYKHKIHKWVPRKQGFSLGRLHNVPPSSSETFYLRILLNKIKGATSYEEIRTINSVLYPSFKEACFALGLIDDDKEFIEAIQETSTWACASQLRKLFVTMLLSNTLSSPDVVWNKTWHLLSEDVNYHTERELQLNGMDLSDEQKKNFALFEIEKLLRSNGKSLKLFPPMPLPEGTSVSDLQNRLIIAQLNYDKIACQLESEELINNMTEEQKNAFDTIMEVVNHNTSKVFFLNGYGGTGKTYLWKALSAAIRARGKIVLNVASSGIASVLLPGGRTAHSQFSIPLQVTDESTCNIKQGSPLSELIRKTRLIIWDEAPMVKKQCFEAVDRTFRDLLRVDNPNSGQIPFGGKIIVFGGDFRQILPVIPKGSRSDIVNHSLNSSYIWDYCQVLTLSKNMRLSSIDTCQNAEELKKFAEWILKVGDGKLNEPNDGEIDIEIPQDLLLMNYTNPLDAIVSSTYPNLQQNFNDPQYLKDRAILAPTLEAVEKIDEFILSQIPGDEKTYLSSDSVCKTTDDENLQHSLYTTEFLNSIKCSGLPNHKLSLKIGVAVMLLRNIDQSSGLCNGTRLIVTQLGSHVIGATLMNTSNFGQQVLIPRMNLSPSDSKWPFKVQRRQFPVAISYAMTINKSQGQSLSNVGLYLPKPLFTHGQLYVAISRVKSKHGLKILIHDKENVSLRATNNIVFKEVFQNIY